LGDGFDVLLSVGPGRESIDIAVSMTVHDPAGDVGEVAHRLTPLIFWQMLLLKQFCARAVQ
jgi:hypothetical protein